MVGKTGRDGHVQTDWSQAAGGVRGGLPESLREEPAPPTPRPWTLASTTEKESISIVLSLPVGATLLRQEAERVTSSTSSLRGGGTWGPAARPLEFAQHQQGLRSSLFLARADPCNP